MDKFCEDCIHNEVCQYGAIPPHIGRCNDKDTLDDIIPQGKWIFDEFGRKICGKCQFPFAEFQSNNYCSLCGADMRKGEKE